MFQRYLGDLCKLIDKKMLERKGCPPVSPSMTNHFIMDIAKGMWNLHYLGILDNGFKAVNVLILSPTYCQQRLKQLELAADFESLVGMIGNEGFQFVKRSVHGAIRCV